ncbi:MAG: OmpA family protein [Bacteroidota bacterium]
MRRILAVLIIIITTTSYSKAQNAVATDAVTTDKYGNIYIVGGFEGAIKSDNLYIGSAGGSDAYIAKYSKNGVCQWITSAGGVQYDVATGVAVDKDGYVYVCGNFTDTASFDYITVKGKGEYAFIAKYNPSGDIIWVKKANAATAYDIAIDGSNYVYVTGSFYGVTNFEKETEKSNGDTDGFLAKYSPNGKVEWSKHFGGTGKDVAMSIDIIPGLILVGGSFSSSATFGDRSINGSTNDGFLANYSTAGTLNWIKNSSEESNKSVVNDVHFTHKKDALIALQTVKRVISPDSKNSGLNFNLYQEELGSAFQINSSSDGNLLTKKLFEGFSYPNAIASDNNENIYITGSYKNKITINNKVAETDASDSGFDFYIAKINNQNNTEWIVNSGFTKDDAGKDITVDNEKNIIAIGEFAGVAKFGKIELTNSGNFCVYLTKLNSNGEILWAKKAIEPEPNFDANSKKYRNIYAKLLVGETEKKSIINQVVNLKGEGGEIIRTTTTDIYGDFSFKSIDEGKQVNIEIEKNSEVKDDIIYIANQSGNVITKIQRDKDQNFSYTILPHDFNALIAIPEEENISIKLKDFKKSKENEITITQNIYFDSGSIKISKEEEKKIAEVAKIMRSNPGYFVDVLAYTDADGDDNANLELSAKRAKSVADLIATKGVKPTNISSKGLGETKILNRCLNGIDCSDKEKMMNRRTEFKIFKVAPAIETPKKKGK